MSGDSGSRSGCLSPSIFSAQFRVVYETVAMTVYAR